MVEIEGTEGEEEARKAYRAAREESDHAAESSVGDKVSTALINRVRMTSVILFLFSVYFVITSFC